MFVLKNVGKFIFGSGGSQESIVELPQGQLYLVRPLSPKGYSELIFKDATASIRRTGQDFQYQLVIQRVYEEGEAELLAEEDEDAEIEALANERDEKTFLLDEALHFRIESREGSEQVLAWRDLSGDAGDVYEFVCDAAVDPAQVEKFERIAKECQYERKYRKPHTTASEADLEQFEFDEAPIPQASPIHSPTIARPLDPDEMFSIKNTANTGAKRIATPPTALATTDGSPEQKEVKAPTAKEPPKVPDQPEPQEILSMEIGELHFYDFPSGAFVLKDPSVTAQVSDVGNWNYWLHVASKDQDWLGIPVVADINPVFNFEFLSFIFNQFTEDGSAYSWLLRFKDQATLERFQEGLMRALWEQLNEVKWTKVKDKEREYVLEAFEDLKMDDAPAAEEEEEEVEAEAEEEEEEEEDTGAKDEHYDTDEEYDDFETQPKDGATNKSIAVGYKHDRSFIVRGSKIGVFKHTPNNQMEFSTNISKVETPKGTLFSPKKVMLHNEDRNMILQNETDPNKLYRMDLEYGKVVDEWNVHEDIPVVSFAPENKFAQMTHEPTFLGIGTNSLFRIDPRLPGDKLVDSQLKQYASKNDFSALSTTQKGYVAVASNKGDIRLFDRLGINAKTHIPALGEPIIGLDVSADGRWVLATCRTYLLLIDALQKEGKNEGKLGFEKSFAATAKPQPRRLALTPEHVAQFAYETGKPVHFTPARFNTGHSLEETSIITATGPFIIDWNLNKVLRGMKAPYSIKRYTEEVKADDFKFGTDQNVIVALPNEVNMVGKGAFKKPTRQSIMGAAARLSTPRRSSGRIGTRQSGRYKLGRDDVVDSPY